MVARSPVCFRARPDELAEFDAIADERGVSRSTLICEAMRRLVKAEKAAKARGRTNGY